MSVWVISGSDAAVRIESSCGQTHRDFPASQALVLNLDRSENPIALADMAECTIDSIWPIGRLFLVINLDELHIVSPKRDLRFQNGWEGFFPYYAGFPEVFVDSILSSINAKQSAIVLDPWNGSGTTTFAASRAGYRSIGQDINPVMVAVARARLLPTSEADSLIPIARTVLEGIDVSAVDASHDPLRAWFTRGTASILRAIERSISHHLIGEMTFAPDGIYLDRLSSIAATFYVALFAVCRDLATKYRSSNPTWFRVSRSGERRVSVPRNDVEERFERHIGAMANALASRPLTTKDVAPAEIFLADSVSCNVSPGSIDIVLTSPPYCTRIDYTAATRIEIAVASPLMATNPYDLSRQMVGSIRVPSGEIAPNAAWGQTCLKFLEAVRNHDSKASGGYYWKTHADYFDKMSRSLESLSLAVKDGGVAIMVVQDSYYKDIHNDLPSIIAEMAEVHNFELERQQAFYLRKSLSLINPGSRTYKRRHGAVESVLCFRKVPSTIGKKVLHDARAKPRRAHS